MKKKRVYKAAAGMLAAGMLLGEILSGTVLQAQIVSGEFRLQKAQKLRAESRFSLKTRLLLQEFRQRMTHM